jgi:hypothetical protein
MMLEELRLNTEDLHELAKQATDRSWESIRSARIGADEVPGPSDSDTRRNTQKV